MTRLAVVPQAFAALLLVVAPPPIHAAPQIVQVHRPECWPELAAVTAETPFGPSWAIDSEAAGNGLVAAGSGAGVLIFDGDLAGPPIRLNAGGFVKDVELTSTRLYAAAGGRGVAVYDRSTWSQQTTLMIPCAEPYERAEVMSVVTLAGGRDIVCLGTGDGAGTGRVLVYDTARPPGLELALSYATPYPVRALVATKDFYANSVTVIGTSSCGPVFVLNSATDTPSLSFTTYLPPLDLSGTIARDMLLHQKSPSEWRLYMAAYDAGVRAFEITPGMGFGSFVITEYQGIGWPIDPTDGLGGVDYAGSLALDPVHGRLAVGLIMNLVAEKQFSPGCFEPFLCNGADRYEVPLDIGVMVYDVSSFTAAPMKIATANPAAVNHTIVGMSLSFRSSGLNEFVIDCGSHGPGIARLDFTGGGTSFTVSNSTWWDVDDDLPGTNNVIWIQNDTLNTCTEALVLGHALHPAGGGPPLSVPGNGDPGPGANGISGFAGTSARIVGVGPYVVGLWDTSASYENNPHFVWSAPVDSDMRLSTTMIGLDAPGVPSIPPRRWALFFAFKDSVPGSMGQQALPWGSVRVQNFGYYPDPGEPAPSEIAHLTWYDLNSTPKVAFKFFDGTVRPIDASSAWVYCTANRLTEVATGVLLGEPVLVRFRMTVTAQRPNQPIASDWVYVPLGFQPEATIPQVWRVHYDPDGDYVYAALACKGAAIFRDLSPDSSPPALVGSVIGGLPGPAFDIARGPGQSIYVSLLDGGIAVIPDRGAPTAGIIHVFPTRFQALGLAPDPDSPDRRSIYIADTQGGVIRMYFSPLVVP